MPLTCTTDSYLWIPEHGHILDAGCGSGRDTLAFKLKGYQVTAFDASSALSGLAKVLTGLPVETCRFDEFSTDLTFDGIWACASLLHVPLLHLPDNISHLANFLEEKGAFYCSFKYGEGEVTRGRRHFSNLTEISLSDILSPTPLSIKESWISNDLRPGREKEQWLNAILRHKEV